MARWSDETSGLLRSESPKEKQRILAEIFTRHRKRLHSMVNLRLDPRLRARIDPSDVLQDAYMEAQERLEEYLRSRPMPLFLWLRRITGQKLYDLQSHHMKAGKRSVRREQAPLGNPMPEATSEVIADRLSAKVVPSPSEAMLHAEVRARVQEALDRMDPLDREVLALRFFEQLTGAETAQALGIAAGTARMRYFRALQRLREVLGPAGLRRFE